MATVPAQSTGTPDRTSAAFNRDASQRPDANQTRLKATVHQIRFLQHIYGDTEGWIEVCYSPAPPDQKPKPKMERFGWYWYTPAKAAEIAEDIARLARRYDVYVGWAVYSQSKRSKEFALPGPSIFTDDVTAGDYSFALQTSPQSQHGWYLLDAPADTATREDLARRIAYAAGGDKSGWDITQLVRVPDTINTKQKYGGRFPVRVQRGTNRRYSTEALQAELPPVEHVSTHVESMAVPGNVSHYVEHCSRILARIKPDTLTHDRLHGRRMVQGENGDDGSGTRWAVAHDLRRYYRLPAAELWAMLLVHCEYGDLQAKGSRWLYADIGRCIAHALTHVEIDAECPTRTIPRTDGPSVNLPEVERVKRGRGRPVAHPEHALLDHLRTHGGVDTNSDLAAALGRSERTITRWLKALAEQGAITITYAKAGRFITVAEVDTKSPPAIKVRARADENTPPVVNPVSPAGANVPLLAEAMADAFDALSGNRASRRRIAEYLHANHPDADWSYDDLEHAYQAERERRQRQRDFQRQVAALPTLKHAKFKRREDWCARLLEAGPDAPEGKKYWLARRLAPYIAAERERRGPILKRLKAGQSSTKFNLQPDSAMSDNQHSPPKPPLSATPAAQPSLFAAACVSPQTLEVSSVAGYRPPLPNGQSARVRIVVRGDL